MYMYVKPQKQTTAMLSPLSGTLSKDSGEGIPSQWAELESNPPDWSFYLEGELARHDYIAIHGLCPMVWLNSHKIGSRRDVIGNLVTRKSGEEECG